MKAEMRIVSNGTLYAVEKLFVNAACDGEEWRRLTESGRPTGYIDPEGARLYGSLEAAREAAKRFNDNWQVVEEIK